jgi:hypothetical protein
MWMTIAGWVMVVLALVHVVGEFTGQDYWHTIGGETLDLVVDRIVFGLAAVVWAVSWFMDRSARA